MTIDGLVREGAFRRAVDCVHALALGAVRAWSRLAQVLVRVRLRLLLELDADRLPSSRTVSGRRAEGVHVNLEKHRERVRSCLVHGSTGTADVML